MKSLKRILFIILLSGFFATTVQAQENTNYFLHIIEKGQSLYSISSMYGVSQEDIIKLNPGCEEKIYAGHALKIPQNKEVAQKDVFHSIQPGETLYRLTKMYDVSAKEIIDENPGLSAENFKIGEVVRIPIQQKAVVEAPKEEPTPEIPAAVVPRCREMHKVKRKETIFSVSRKYDITEQELKDANPELEKGMKRGQFLCIPYPTEKPKKERKRKETLVNPPSNRELFSENKERYHQIPTIKAAIILPFLLEGEGKNESAKMVEYYEGFLIAVDSLKKRGISTELFVYDSGNKQASINNVLAKEELKSMDIIFGPLYQEHVQPLSDFADEHNIRLVIPTSRANEVYQNPLIYQVNPPQSYLYSEVYEHFTRNFLNANVVILDMKTNERDKTEFIEGLKQELIKQRTPVKTINGNSSAAEMKNLLVPGKQNIFIPTSGSSSILIKILPQLKVLVREAADYKVSLFGYPEWQTYTGDHLDAFFELDTYFYSWFYSNNLLPTARNFVNSYHKWYSKEMVPTYPRYGMLGYDTAIFFLSGLSKYGTGLEANISKMDIWSIQSGLKFERVNNWGGFINKKVFFVHFTKGFEIVKMDFD